MKKIVVILSALLSFCCVQAHAGIVYVDSANVNGVHNGLSWATAFNNFQSAIDAAHSGDSLWVAKGMYQPAAGSSFAMKDSVTILGGFLNTHTLLSERDWHVNIARLKGNGSLVIINSLLNPLSPAASLDGFFITEGLGGGMENSFSSPTISNCIFYNNNGLTDASAMQNNFCSSIITNCTFANNQGSATVINADFGAFAPDINIGPTFIGCLFTTNTGTQAGAVVNANCKVSFLNCDFILNSSTLNAGAMANLEADVTLNNCKFNYNFAAEKGGGMYQDNCISTISNCSFLENRARIGGGLANYADTIIRPMNLSKTSFNNNHATSTGTGSLDQIHGGGAFNRGKATIDSCTFVGNVASFNNSGAIGGGLYSSASNPSMITQLSNSYFYNNKAMVGALTWFASNGLGGGASVNYGNVSNCTFDSNESSIFGGGLAVFGSSALDGKVTNCTFTRNKSRRGGGLIGSAEVKISNCLIAKNTADSFGGGMFIPIYQNRIAKITNNTLTQNQAGSAGGGIYFFAYSAITSPYHMSNNIVWANNTGIDKLASLPEPTITYSLIQDRPANTALHNLDGSTDPLFVDSVAENYQLLMTSICVNAGRNDSLPATITNDLLQHVRIYDGIVDLGAYEYGIFQPAVWLGQDTSFCTGNSLLLQAPYYSASNYLWSTGALTQTIEVVTPGTYVVSITNMEGTATDTIEVTELSIPIINLGNDTIFCSDQTIQLDAQNAGSTYKWSTNATSNMIAVNTPGTYHVTVTGTNGCKNSDTIQIAHYPLPIVNLGNDANISIGSSITLDAGNIGASYLWNTGESTQTITVSAAGTYSVTVTNANGCSDTDEIIITMGLATHDVTTQASFINVRPNPTKDLLNINVTERKLLGSTITLNDAYGRVVLSTVLKQTEGQTLSLSKLVPGMYLLKVGNVQAIKIIKQ